MSSLALWANMISGRLVVNYRREFDPLSEEPTPVPVTLRVYHQTERDNFSVSPVLLQETVVPADFLVLTRTPESNFLSFELSMVNLRYTDELSIQSTETRNSVVLTGAATVLVPETEFGLTRGPLPSNPHRSAEQEENVPFQDLNRLGPADRVVTEREPVVVTKEVALISSPPRIEQKGDDFVEVRTDQPGKLRYSENSALNVSKNPSFYETWSNSGVTSPKFCTLSAPGFSINSKVLPGSLSGTNYWRISASNPNPFNAYDSITLSLGRSTIPLGPETWTFSAYYRLESSTQTLPFPGAKLTLRFYDSDGGFLGAKDSTVPVALQPSLELLSFTVPQSQVPANATVIVPEITLGPVEDTFIFYLNLYLPQLEAENGPTTRTLTGRQEADVWTTTGEITLSPPFYIALETTHLVTPSVRGILDTTTALRSGVQFFVADNRLFFKQLSPTGSVVFSKVSPVFVANNGDTVTYGVYCSATGVRFYLNGVQIGSTLTQAVSINQTAIPRVGSLLAEGTSLNSPILRFGVFRTAPA